MKINKYIILAFLTLVCFFVGLQDILAQCPMCRMSAESNLAHGGTEGKGLNTGILYIFSMPYLLVLTLGLLWWWNNGRHKEEGGVNT